MIQEPSSLPVISSNKNDMKDTDEIILHQHDVLCGRGGNSNNHPGNVVFRSVVAANKKLYASCPKYHKTVVSNSILDAIRMRDPPGRFIDRNADGKCYLINHTKTMEKISQALREKYKRRGADSEESRRAEEANAGAIHEMMGHIMRGLSVKTNLDSDMIQNVSRGRAQINYKRKASGTICDAGPKKQTRPSGENNENKTPFFQPSTDRSHLPSHPYINSPINYSYAKDHTSIASPESEIHNLSKSLNANDATNCQDQSITGTHNSYHLIRCVSDQSEKNAAMIPQSPSFNEIYEQHNPANEMMNGINHTSEDELNRIRNIDGIPKTIECDTRESCVQKGPSHVTKKSPNNDSSSNRTAENGSTDHQNRPTSHKVQWTPPSQEAMMQRHHFRMKETTQDRFSIPASPSYPPRTSKNEIMDGGYIMEPPIANAIKRSACPSRLFTRGDEKNLPRVPSFADNTRGTYRAQTIRNISPISASPTQNLANARLPSSNRSNMSNHLALNALKKWGQELKRKSTKEKKRMHCLAYRNSILAQKYRSGDLKRIVVDRSSTHNVDDDLVTTEITSNSINKMFLLSEEEMEELAGSVLDSASMIDHDPSILPMLGMEFAQKTST